MEELIAKLTIETERNTDETRKTNDRLLKLWTELKTRNEIDKCTMKRQDRMIYFLIVVVCLFAGLDVAKLVGLF